MHIVVVLDSSAYEQNAIKKEKKYVDHLKSHGKWFISKGKDDSQHK